MGESKRKGSAQAVSKKVVQTHMEKKPSNKSQTRRERQAARRRATTIRNIGIIAGGALFLIALFFLTGGRSPAQSVTVARQGSPLGDFALQDLEGNTVKLSDYAGHPVLINSWATWCPPCRAEMPDLQAYYQAHQDEGFIILALNAGEAKGTAANFAAGMGLSFPVLLDPGTNVLNAMGIRNFPTSILVGRDGIVKTVHIGLFTPEALEQEITPYLAE